MPPASTLDLYALWLLLPLAVVARPAAAQARHRLRRPRLRHHRDERAGDDVGHLQFPAPRNEDTHASGLGFFRNVVDRTLACFSQFWRLRVCYERRGEHFQAFHDPATCCLVFTRLRHYELQF